jgi:hypothetical protein
LRKISGWLRCHVETGRGRAAVFGVILASERLRWKRGF